MTNKSDNLNDDFKPTYLSASKGTGNNFKTLDENYRKMLSDEKLSTAGNKKRKISIIAWCAVGLLLAGLITVSVINYIRVLKPYNHAVSVAFNGSYEKAKALLENFEKDYRDTEALIALCESHINYDNNLVASAYCDMDKVYFHYLTPEQSKKVDEYRDKLETDYDEFMKRKAESDSIASRYRIANGVPYVGMFESDIKNTSLGAPSDDVRHNYECINGEQYLANLYDFKSGYKKIFTARCVNGRVTEVWDYRNNPIVPYTPKKSTQKKNHSDPYDVNDYSNEEDFYDDHYDDFFDYYDAEDYYNEHHK